MAKALYGQVGDQVGQVKDQVSQGQGQELDNIPLHRWLYLENVMKFSFQEHTCPPRIQEENFGFSSLLQISNVWAWLDMRKALKPLTDLHGS